MESRYLVRIIKTELYNFKNVKHGQIRYMNYSSVENHAQIDTNDIVGIYGQNGSGKTAMVEALDILRGILAGESIPYEPYEGLLSKNQDTKLDATFYMEYLGEKYKVKYEAVLVANTEEKKINLSFEKIMYWRRGKTWKAERDICFENPYYNQNSILDNAVAELQSEHKKEIEKVKVVKGIQSLAVYCAQKGVSIFFNDLMLNKIVETASDDIEEKTFHTITRGMTSFGRMFFQVVKVNQLAEINRNMILPVNIHSESKYAVLQGCLPLVMKGQGKVPEQVYKQLKEVIDAINIALKAIIPNLMIELKPVDEELDKDGNNNVLVEVYSVRNDKRFLTRYESEGIKRIISLLSYLISLYNYPEICLVVDELDSGVFEYLLGEILGVLNEEAKGQLIFTSHNLRAFEKLNIKNIVCTTINPQNRYIRLTGKEANHNPRDFYIRTITVGGQKEEMYDEADLQSMGYAFRMACKPEDSIKIHFSEQFRKKLEGNTKE